MQFFCSHCFLTTWGPSFRASLYYLTQGTSLPHGRAARAVLVLDAVLGVGELPVRRRARELGDLARLPVAVAVSAVNLLKFMYNK